jgi:hypothetical protein
MGRGIQNGVQMQFDLTAIAATSAAVISVANLAVATYATSRRERFKWARDSLAEAFYSFIDTSYLYSSALNRYQRLVQEEGMAEEIKVVKQTVQAQRSTLKHAQTKIRLLAPAKTLDQAQRLRTNLDELSDRVSEGLSQQEYDLMKAETRKNRESLIVNAKKSMGLPR